MRVSLGQKICQSNDDIRLPCSWTSGRFDRWSLVLVELEHYFYLTHTWIGVLLVLHLVPERLVDAVPVLQLRGSLTGAIEITLVQSLGQHLPCLFHLL